MLYNEKSKKNLELGRKFSGEYARKAGANGRKIREEKKKERIAFKEALIERLGEDEVNRMLDELKLRATRDDKSLELLLSIIGQKPAEKSELSIDGQMPVVIVDDLGSPKIDGKK